MHSAYSTGCTFFASPVSTLMSTSVRTPRLIAAAISPVNVPNRIMTNGPKQLLKSEKSIFVKPDSMEKPTKINATPVTAVGIIKNSGEWFGAYLYDDQPIEVHRLSDVVEKQTVAYIPAGEYLCGYHYGPYLTIQNSIDQLIQEAARRNLPVDDCVITPNIVDQCCEGHPDNYITGLEVRILSQ